MSNNSHRRKTPAAAKIGTGGAVAIVVVGIFILCVIVVLAKAVFTSNSKELPSGLDTATINTGEPSMAEVDTNSTAAADTSLNSSEATANSADESEKTESNSSESEVVATMYITEYSYLHTEPSEESENIVCMSPGVEVSVLGYEDNGYVKITFMNIDGQLTGYIYQDYLTSSY